MRSTVIEVLSHLAILRLVLDRPELCVGMGAIADDDSARVLDQRVADLVIDAVMYVQPFGGVAELSIVPEGGPK